MIKGLLFAVIFFTAAYMTGSWGEIITGRLGSGRSHVFRFSFGGCVILLAGMLSSALAALFGASVAAAVGGTVFIAVIVAGAAVLVKRHMTVGQTIPNKSAYSIKDMIYPAVFAVFVAVQVAAVISRAFERTAAMRGTGIATAVYDSGHLFVSDPMMLFTGAVSRILGVHPLTFIYGIAPFVFIPLYYLCYAQLINTVCSKTYKRIVAFGFVVLLNLWGYQSDVLIRFTLLARWFGLGVFFVHGLLNTAAVIMTVYLQSRLQKSGSPQNEYTDENVDPEELDMKKARNLAVAIGVLAVILIAAVFVLNNKINNLYDATVNLQTDMNSRCSIYEFAPGGGDTAGYLIKNSDGTLVFVGGGSSENADELSEFFDRYGTDIAKWYLYGDDEENAGAMRKLSEAGSVNADKVYVIDARELTDKK